MRVNTPFISVIVPNFNHSQFLELRLDSIFNQTYQNFEVILLDDVSSDVSRDILIKYRNHPKVSSCIFNKHNSGSTFKQWGKGINLAKGEYVWIAESDDYCEENFLEKLIKPFLQDQDVALTYCQSHRVNANNKITGSWNSYTAHFNEDPFQENFIMNGNKFIENFLIHKNVIPNVSGVLFRKEKLEKIVPLTFKPYMKYNADWFYYIQLLCNTKIGFIAESLNYFRYHERSVIAKAGEESGWFKIFKMELKARSKMMEHIKDCNPSNLKNISEQYKKSNDYIHYLTAMGFVNRGRPIRGISLVYNKPPLLKKLLLHIIAKYKEGNG